MDIPDVTKDPSIGVSYNCVLEEQGSLVLQTFVPRDSDPKDLNDALDKLRKAAERQIAFAKLDKAKRDLEAQRKQAIDHARRIEQLDERIKESWSRSNKRGDPKLSVSEQTEQKQAYANAEELKRRIEFAEKTVAHYEAIIGA